MPLKFNFNTQVTRRQPIREAPTKFLSSRLRPHIERSEGERLSEALIPYKCLPTMFIDTETEDAVVLLKGTIVSLLTNQTRDTVTPSGIVPPQSSGTIPVFEDATVGTSVIVAANIDTSYFGYDDSIAALLVPANGGVANRMPYSADDATIGTFTCSGQVVTAAMAANPESNYCMLEPNMPVGVVYQDVFQDIRGRNLNYNLWEVWGVLCDFYIEVPYVDFGALSTFVSGYVDAIDEHVYNLSATTCAGYIGTWRRHAFFYFDGTDGNRDGQAGQLVQSDLNGKFIPQAAAAAAINTAANTQTVGKLILTDSRFPKDMMDVVDTYPGSRMPGTETAGLPSALYEFVRDSLFGITGSYPTIQTCLNNVRAGAFGIARIQLNI